MLPADTKNDVLQRLPTDREMDAFHHIGPKKWPSFIELVKQVNELEKDDREILIGILSISSPEYPQASEQVQNLHLNLTALDIKYTTILAMIDLANNNQLAIKNPYISSSQSGVYAFKFTKFLFYHNNEPTNETGCHYDEMQKVRQGIEKSSNFQEFVSLAPKSKPEVLKKLPSNPYPCDLVLIKMGTSQNLDVRLNSYLFCEPDCRCMIGEAACDTIFSRTRSNNKKKHGYFGREDIFRLAGSITESDLNQLFPSQFVKTFFPEYNVNIVQKAFKMKRSNGPTEWRIVTPRFVEKLKEVEKLDKKDHQRWLVSWKPKLVKYNDVFIKYLHSVEDTEHVLSEVDAALQLENAIKTLLTICKKFSKTFSKLLSSDLPIDAETNSKSEIPQILKCLKSMKECDTDFTPDIEKVINILETVNLSDIPSLQQVKLERNFKLANEELEKAKQAVKRSKQPKFGDLLFLKVSSLYAYDFCEENVKKKIGKKRENKD